MTASSKMNSYSDSNRIDEILGNFTVEEGDLFVNEKNIDRQTYADHSENNQIKLVTDSKSSGSNLHIALRRE